MIEYIEVSFEDLQADPQSVLRHIVEFFDLPGDEVWMTEAVGLLTPGKAGRATPSPQEAETLRTYCHPALALPYPAPLATTGRRGVLWRAVVMGARPSKPLEALHTQRDRP